MTSSIMLTGCNVSKITITPKSYEEYQKEKNNDSLEFQNLPKGTVVEFVGGYIGIISTYNFVWGDEKYDYCEYSYPFINPGIGRSAFNSDTDRIEQVIIRGVEDINSLEKIDEIPDKLLPIGSIFKVYDYKDYGDLTLIIIAHNFAEGLKGVEEERLDYTCKNLEQIEEEFFTKRYFESDFLFLNHEEIDELIYISPETKYAQFVRLKLMEKEKNGIKTNKLQDEDVDEEFIYYSRWRIELAD